MLQQRINDAMQNLNTWGGGCSLLLGERGGSGGGGEPVASQKGATCPVLSKTGLSEGQNNVPEVPRDTTRSPVATAPTPSALIMLSPLPGATATPAGRPSAAAAAPRRVPAVVLAPRRSGNAPESEGRTREMAAESCVRECTSKTPVPLASPHCTHVVRPWWWGEAAPRGRAGDAGNAWLAPPSRGFR